MNRCCRGFSLLELLVVLTIMALAASFVGPRFKSRDRTMFSVQVRKVVSVLQYARRKALITGWPQEVTIAEMRSGGDGETGITIAWLDPEPDVSAEGSGEGTLHGRGRDRAPAAGALLFFPDGSSSGDKIVVTGGGRRQIISVNPVTGKIAME